MMVQYAERGAISVRFEDLVTRPITERLSDAQRRAIWDLTGGAAAQLGYTVAGSLAALT